MSGFKKLKSIYSTSYLPGKNTHPVGMEEESCIIIPHRRVNIGTMLKIKSSTFIMMEMDRAYKTSGGEYECI
jgi:hypothetical protein